MHDGKKIQPEAPISIQIKTDSNIKFKEETKVEAVHFQSANKAEVVPEVETNEENNQVSEISFDAGSFSDYGVVGAEYYKVTFLAQDQTILSLVDKKEGSKVETLPEKPFRAGYRFIGWRDNETKEIVTADTLVTKDMTVEAEFASISIYKVTIQYFYNNNDTSGQEVIFKTEVYELEAEGMPYRITTPVSTEIKSGLAPGAIYYTSRPIIDIQSEDLSRLDKEDGNVDHALTIKVAYIPYNSEYKVHYKLKDLDGTGYTDIIDPENPENPETYRGIIGFTIRPEVRNYPYANFEKTDSLELTESSGQEVSVYYTRKEYTLSYNTNGGSYIPPQTGLYNATVNLTPKEPTRDGYAFDGWYDNANFTGSPISDSVTLDKNKTLYAKWKADTVKYTIAYYKEVYNNSTGRTYYAYDSSINATGQVGTTVQASSAPAMSNIPLGYERETAYGKNANSSVVIDADGQSVLKVYYSLIRYTFVFDLNNTNGRITIGGQTYRDSQYQIKDVVLGQDVSSQWPSSTSNPKEVYDDTTYGGWFNTYRQYFDFWSPNFKTKHYEVTTTMLPTSGTTRTYTATWTRTSTQASVEYWLQQTDGSYQKSDKYNQSFIRTGSLGAKQIFGYDYLGDGVNPNPSVYPSSQITSNPYTYRFYYSRKSFFIQYNYKSEVLKTEQGILFDADISSYNSEPTQRPSGVDSDYEWKGWYTDSNLTEAYTFDKMPSNNLVLYAKWVAPNMTVSFNLNGGEGTAPETQTVEKKKTATVVADPTRAHYDFDGWFTAKEGGERYVWSKPVTENITLYARWKPQPLKYTVKYVDATTNNRLAADKVIESPALELHQVIKENALAITDYRPDASSKTLDLTYDNNEIIFYYSDRTAKIPYTIRYLLKDGDDDDSNNKVLLQEDRLEADANMIVATVVAKSVGTGYYPQNNVLSLTLTTNSANNIITFYYLPYEFATLTVNYLDMDGKPIAGQDPLVEYKKKADTYILNRKEIQGYTFSTSKDNENNVDKSIYRITRPDKWTINLYYKKNLTLTATNKSKIYNGQTLESVGLTDINSDYQAYLEPGDTLDSIAFAGSQTDVGQSETTPKDAVLKSGTTDRNYFYNIQYTPGVLTVTPQPVIVHIAGEIKDKIYDGKEEAVGYKVMEIRDTSGLYKETDIHFNGSSLEQSVKEKNAGIYPLLLNNRFTNTNQNFQVDFLISDGELRIDRRQLTITSDSASKDYDGSELRADNITVSVPAGVDYTGFVDGEGVVPTFLGGPTKPGFMANDFNYQHKDGTNLANYKLDKKLGQLKVKEVIKIQKTDLAWQALSGGKFGLTKWDGHNWARVDGAQEVDIKDGINIPVGLEPGLYRLQELAAPDGFIVLDNYIYFTIKDNFNENQTTSFYTVSLSDEIGNDANPDRAQLNESTGDASHLIKVANEKGRALPNTGGSGRNWIILSGLVFMVVSLVVQYSIKQRRERGSLD